MGLKLSTQQFTRGIDNREHTCSSLVMIATGGIFKAKFYVTRNFAAMGFQWEQCGLFQFTNFSLTWLRPLLPLVSKSLLFAFKLVGHKA